MSRDEIRRRSRWIIRAMEWDDTKAKYPNLWYEAMPRHILALDRLAHRVRLGDLIGIYYPHSSKHPERSERYLGLSRIVGIRQADQPGTAWVDLQTAHRFAKPLDLGRAPERVFLCCDPGWPDGAPELFQTLFDAAVGEGWRPTREEALTAAAEETEPPEARTPTVAARPRPVPAPEPGTPERVEQPRLEPISTEGQRLFAGADFSGDMRDPRDRTWLAVVMLASDRLRVVRLDATGRHGLQALLRNPQRDLMHAEAVGLGFPFGLPIPFAETLMGKPFPAEGWWALAKRLESVSWPDYLVALQKFRDARGEIRRLADERVDALSPLHRVAPDMGSRTYHGIRMIAEDRSRFAIRPFESAQGKLLFEVSPAAVVRKLEIDGVEGNPRGEREAILAALGTLSTWPLELDARFRTACLDSRDALDAVIAARSAAAAVLSAEADRSPEELAPQDGERIRREGWIYGLHESGLRRAG